MSRFLTLLLLVCVIPSFASDTYRLEVKLSDFEGDTLYLGYYLGKGQYYQDTAVTGGDRTFVFEGESLEPGVYLIVAPPQNRYFQFIINEQEQHISMNTSLADPMSDMVIEGSEDTELFYEYMQFLSKRRADSDSLNSILAGLSGNEPEAQQINERLDQIDGEVRTFQRTLVESHPDKLTSAIVRAGLEIEMPEFKGTEEEKQLKSYKYYKKHYFDNVDLANPGLLRSPMLFSRVQSYLDRLTPRHPDSISESLTRILDAMKPAPETFKYYLVHYLNEYAGSKIVGMDAVYVTLVEQYYMTGDATWTDEEQLEKIVENAMGLKPLLIGKVAPDVELEDREGNPVSLHGIKSPYTVFYIWQPDCGHCKKQTPKLIDFYREYKDKGIEVVAVCMKFTKEVSKCWDYIDEREGMNLWYNLVDPYNRSKYPTLYYVKSTPQLYVLDADKKILTKRIGVEQLPEVMDTLMKELDENEKEG